MIYSCVSKVIQYIVGKFENRINMMAKIKIMTREGIYSRLTQKVSNLTQKVRISCVCKLTEEGLNCFTTGDILAAAGTASTCKEKVILRK